MHREQTKRTTSDTTESEVVILEQRLRMANAVSDISSRLARNGNLNANIDSSLAQAGALVGADRVYVFQFRNEGAIIDNTFEWCTPGVIPQIEKLQGLASDTFGWFIGRISGGEIFEIADVGDLPAEASAEKSILESQGIKSLVIMPFGPVGLPTGFVGFDNVRDIGQWRSEDTQLLRVISRLIGDALERKQAHQALEENAERYRRLVDSLPAIVYRYSPGRGASYWSPQVEQILGCSPKALHDNPFLWHDAIHPDDLPMVDNAIMDFGVGKHIDLVYRIRDAEGKWHWFHDRSIGRLDVDGEVVIEGLAFDITAQKRGERALRESEQRYRGVVEDTPVLICRFLPRGEITFVNEAYCRYFGKSAEELENSNFLELIPEKDREFVMRNIESLSMGSPTQSHDHRVVTPDGEIRWQRWTNRALFDKRGGVLAYQAIGEDITERRRLDQELIYAATHDSLTGLVNRAEFERRIDQAVAGFIEQGTPQVLCYLDLDQFKVVNDAAGHTAGDEMLKQVADLLAANIRSRDTLARLGGDEFGLLLEHCSVDNAERIAKGLIDSLGEFRFTWENRMFGVGASVGLVPFTLDGAKRSVLASRADMACFAAKDMGRNRVYVYHPKDTELMRRHHEIIKAAELREALEEDRFELFVQPITSASEPYGEPWRYEVLVRLRDRDGELLSPGTFIPAAERYGLIGDLDRWVIRTALREYAALGERYGGAGIAINISGNSLSDESLPMFVRSELMACGVKPARICFEITETAAVNRLSLARRFIEDLREHGCSFALDDFGSGLSSFKYLKNLPVQFLKLDGTFVRDMANDPVDDAMVKAINEIGHVLGIKTVAEHVENQKVLSAAIAGGVDFLQGFEIGRPMPLREIGQRKAGKGRRGTE